MKLSRPISGRPKISAGTIGMLVEVAVRVRVGGFCLGGSKKKISEDPILLGPKIVSHGSGVSVKDDGICGVSPLDFEK